MAYRYDLKIDQGATLALEIECQDDLGGPLDLTGYGAAAQIRYRHQDPDPAAVFDAAVDPVAGSVTLRLDAAKTAALVRAQGVWDCELTGPDGSVQRLAEGRVTVSREVTR